MTPERSSEPTIHTFSVITFDGTMIDRYPQLCLSGQDASIDMKQSISGSVFDLDLRFKLSYFLVELLKLISTYLLYDLSCHTICLVYLAIRFTIYAICQRDGCRIIYLIKTLFAKKFCFVKF